MNTPNPSNALLGSGEWLFNRINSSGNYVGWMSLGNAKQGQLSASGSSVETKNYLRGARGPWASTPIETAAKAMIKSLEADSDILAVAFLGERIAWSQGSGSATDAAIAQTVLKGFAVDVGKYKITVTAVKKASTTLVEGTDYTYDSEAGLIRILTGGSTLSDGDSITWSGSYAAITSTKILGLTQGKITGKLKFVPAVDQTGPRRICEIFKAQISPKGVLDLISEAHVEIDLEFDMIQDGTRVSTTQSPYFEFYDLP